MRLHRFYTTEELAPGKEITINSAELIHQISRVFRLKIGDKITLFNGTGFDYVGNIANYSHGGKIDSDNSMVVSIDPTTPARSRFTPEGKLFLYAALVKKDTFEWIVEKATELGVTDIVPVMADRSEKKSLNEDRLKKIAVEASEQSGRGDVPTVHEIISLAEAINPEGKIGRSKEAKIIAFHTEGEMFHGGDFLGPTSDRAVFIGPEGGWSAQEVELFHKNNIPVRCLGSQILRAETAVVATLSLVVFGE